MRPNMPGLPGGPLRRGAPHPPTKPVAHQDRRDDIRPPLIPTASSYGLKLSDVDMRKCRPKPRDSPHTNRARRPSSTPAEIQRQLADRQAQHITPRQREEFLHVSSSTIQTDIAGRTRSSRISRWAFRSNVTCTTPHYHRISRLSNVRIAFRGVEMISEVGLRCSHLICGNLPVDPRYPSRPRCPLGPCGPATPGGPREPWECPFISFRNLAPLAPRAVPAVQVLLHTRQGLSVPWDLAVQELLQSSLRPRQLLPTTSCPSLLWLISAHC